MEQSVGWGVRERCGCGRVGVDELSGCCTSGVEVINKEFKVGSHGMVIQVAEVRQIFHVVLLDGSFERGGEEPDWVVGWRWRKVGGGQG